jgi:hypothetical protein
LKGKKRWLVAGFWVLVVNGRFFFILNEQHVNRNQQKGIPLNEQPVTSNKQLALRTHGTHFDRR